MSLAEAARRPVVALVALTWAVCLFATPTQALSAPRTTKRTATSPKRAAVEAARLVRLASQLKRSKPVPKTIAHVLAVAELRGALPPEVIFKALVVVAKAWSSKLDRIAPAPVALRSLLQAVAADLDPEDMQPWLDLPGAVTAWSYLGPLPHGAGTAFDRADSRLDTATDRQDRIAGRDGAIGWRATPPQLAGRLQFAALVERPAAAIVYAETWLRVSRPTVVRLAWIGAGRARLFLAGKQLLDHRSRASAPGAPKQVQPPRIVEVQLETGWQPLRVKLQDDSGVLPLAIRIGDSGGKPLVLEQRSSRPTRANISSSSDGQAKLKRRELSNAHGLLGKALLGDAGALAALAAMRRHNWPAAAGDAVTGLLGKYKKSSAGIGLAWALSVPAAGDVASRLRQLSSSPDPRLLVAHTEALIELDQAAAAHQLHHEFAAANGRHAASLSVRACSQRVDLWLQLGADTAALQQARGCRALWPSSPIALDVMARVMMARDHLDMATHMQERLFRFHPGSARRFLDLLSTMTVRGPPLATQMGFVWQLLKRSPQHQRGWEILARAHLGARQHSQARAALDRLRSWQWRSTTWALSSRIAAQVGDASRAIRDLRVALRAAPSRDDYRARLRRLAPDDRFYQPYQRDLLKFARRAGGTTHPIETLLSQSVIRHDGARQARYEVEVITIGAGGPSEHDLNIEYVPSQSTVEVLQAAVVKPDGRVLRRANRNLERVSEDWYGLYYDLEQLTLSFSGLKAGDTIVVAHVVRDFAADPFGMVFGELLYLGDTRPIRALDVVLELPAGTNLHSVAWDPVARKPLATQLKSGPLRNDRGRRFETWRLQAGPMPAVTLEAAMPGATEVVPYLHASSFASSSEVSRWYAHLVSQALHGADRDAGLATLAKALRGSSQRETIEKVFRYASDEVRYVGLEFGIHSLRPHDASEVLARKFGDCKDKATLIVALLRLLEIDAQVALVRTASNGRLNDPISSLGVFDHAIAYIPALQLWLDATQRHHQLNELPSLDAGGMALRIPLQGHHRATATEQLVRAAANANTRLERRTVKLQATGPSLVAVEVRLTGLPAASARGHLHATATRVERLEEPLSKELPGVKISDVKVAGVVRPAPVLITFSAKAPQIGLTVGDERAIAPLVGAESFVSRFGASADRSHDLLLPYAFEDSRELRLVPPVGWKVTNIPASLTIDTPYLAFDFKCEVAQHQIQCSYRFTARQPRIPSSQHTDWRAQMGRVDRTLSQKIRFTTKGGIR